MCVCVCVCVCMCVRVGAHQWYPLKTTKLNVYVTLIIMAIIIVYNYHAKSELH